LAPRKQIATLPHQNRAAADGFVVGGVRQTKPHPGRSVHGSACYVEDEHSVGAPVDHGYTTGPLAGLGSIRPMKRGLGERHRRVQPGRSPALNVEPHRTDVRALPPTSCDRGMKG